MPQVIGVFFIYVTFVFANTADNQLQRSMLYKLRSTFLFFFLILGNLSAQNKATIKGRILDQTTNEPIEYASVTLSSTLDSTMLYGVVTDEKGVFEFVKVSPSEVYLSARFLGYENHSSTNFFTNKNTDLGDILLGTSAGVLEEVEITGRAITSLQKLDKQVYDAGQFQNAQGGTATDILSNLPSISINSLGEISVRGATGFLVMINGKPVQTDPAVILAQIPANAIEDIEIITAPSAKYDPDGNAGIINIKTKQGATDGLYVIANVLVGLPSVERYDAKEKAQRFGGDITINYKKDKLEWSAGLDYKRNDLTGRRVGYVNTYLDEVLTEFPSNGERSFDNENYSGRFSAIYTPDNRQSIGASFYTGKRTKYRTADILYLNQQRTNIPSSEFLGTEAYWDLYQQNQDVINSSAENLISRNTFFNENLRVRRGDFLIGALDYTIKFEDDAALKISGLYERTILGGPTDNVSLAWPNTNEVLQQQFNDNDNPLDGFRFQLDYARKVGTTNWESGYQFRYLKHPGDFLYQDRDFTTNTWVENPLFTNSIILKRQIHSLYSQVTGESGKLAYTAGLRVEYFDRTVDIAQPDETFDLTRFNLFPSVNLKYDLGNGLAAKAGYSRRIERTTTFKLTPFPEREHSETLEQGDAELQPEYIDLVEVGLVKNMGDNSVFVNAYFRNINDVINRVNTVFNDTILNRIYTNAGRATVYGLELGTTVYPTKWWKLYLGGNAYNYRIEGDLFGDAIETSNTIYSINANTNFTFSPTLNLQLGFNYLSERVTAQGRDSRFYNPNLTLRKTFLDKKLALTFQWINMDLGLLNSNEQRITTVRNNFYTTTNYVYEVDILQLSITYQLNQPSKNVKLIKSEFGGREF